MSVETRTARRGLRRGAKEPERPDYSEPDFSSWAARLDDFVPAGKLGAAPATAEAPAAATASAATPATAPAKAATATVVDDRPSLEDALEQLLSFDGALAVAIVDSQTGMILGSAGSGVEIDLAAAGASTILQARLASTKAMGTNEKIEDLLISLSSQVQIIHPLPQNPSIFTYLIGDKSKSSLAMARYKAAEADLQIKL